VALAIVGTVIAGAVVLGRGWSAAIAVEIFTLLTVGFFYGVGRSDSDVGAVFGNRTDERQRLIQMKARELAMIVMYLTAVICVAIALALKQNYWQADVIGSVGGLTFIVGLRIYGPRDDRAGGADTGIMASSVNQTPVKPPDDFNGA
jgi:hypothetical protein